MAPGWAAAARHKHTRRQAAAGGEARSNADRGDQQHDRAGRYEPAGPAPLPPPQPQVPQRMLVLMGLPGSGKTTLAWRLRQMGWAWINQDVLGDRNKCAYECTQALLAGREVVIDRCNFDAQQRSTWTRLANEGSHLGNVYVIAFHLQVPAGECKRRAGGRVDHPTLNGDKVAEVIDRFATQFQRVQKFEHFDENYRAQSQHDIDNFVQYVGSAFSHPPHLSLHPTDPVTGMSKHMGHATPTAAPIQEFDNTLLSPYKGPQQMSAGSPQPQQMLQQPYLPAHQRRSQQQQQQYQPPPQQQQYQPSPQQQQLYQPPLQQQLYQPPHRQHLYQPPNQQQQQQHQQQPPQQQPLPWESPPQQQPSPLQSNIVAFHSRTPPSAEKGPGSIPARFLDDDAGSTDKRPILLFDLNGTLTSHTAAKRSSGKTLIRPGTHHLRRLQEHFRLGIFTSASLRTAHTVIPLLEAAAGPGVPLFGDKSLILYRDHTELASEEHVRKGGQAWDTNKPLHRWFKHLHRVLLMDDDAYKVVGTQDDALQAVQGEESNMIVVQCWDEEEPEDMHLGMVADLMLDNYQHLNESTDVRLKSKIVSDALAAAVADSMVYTSPESAAAAANGLSGFQHISPEYQPISPPDLVAW